MLNWENIHWVCGMFQLYTTLTHASITQKKIRPKNLIKSWDLVQINNNIEMWSAEWMLTMRNSADKLAEQWIVNEEDYIGYFMEDQ